MQSPSPSLLTVILAGLMVHGSDQQETTTPLPTGLCPPVDFYPCNCINGPPSTGFTIQCSYYYYYYGSPTAIRDVLLRVKPYGPIGRLEVYNIQSNYFNYVPDDFLAGNDIPDVHFVCSHGFSVSTPPLFFSIDAFNSADTGRCGLTGNLTFADCNLRQFNGDILRKCNHQMTGLGFLNSHVENIFRIPSRMDVLTNFTVYYGRYWSGATQQGLVQVPFTADMMPSLSYLDLTGSSLVDDDITVVSELLSLEQLYLEGNNFSVVPNLQNLYSLDQFSILLNDLVPATSIRMPSRRKLDPPLVATIKSSSNAIRSVQELTGDFLLATIDLRFIMNGTFNESVFLKPLQSLTDSGMLILNEASRFDCYCSISWLVRDHPNLVGRVRNGICMDGRPFASMSEDELSCCPNASMAEYLHRVESEVELLRKTVRDLEAEISQCHAINNNELVRS